MTSQRLSRTPRSGKPPPGTRSGKRSQNHQLLRQFPDLTVKDRTAKKPSSCVWRMTSGPGRVALGLARHRWLFGDRKTPPEPRLRKQFFTGGADLYRTCSTRGWLRRSQQADLGRGKRCRPPFVSYKGGKSLADNLFRQRAGGSMRSASAGSCGNAACGSSWYQ